MNYNELREDCTEFHIGVKLNKKKGIFMARENFFVTTCVNM